MTPFPVPILFITFNRPEETRQSLNRIREIQPAKLYIAQDGPSSPEQKKKTDEVFSIISSIDWECDVKYLVQKENLGCGAGVNAALDWFFENEEMGIILEDDILPDPSFFSFAGVLLEKYRYDTRIMLISGNNLLGEYPGPGDYFFSKIGAIWGWASWRRAWQIHDKSMANWEEIKKDPIAAQILPDAMWEEHVKNIDKVLSGEIDTWDYPFTLTLLINSGLSILPRKNLIRNIGFNENATHTKNKPEYIAHNTHTIDVEGLTHPLVIAPENDFDSKYFSRRQSKSGLYTRFKNKAYNLFKNRKD